MLNQAGEYSEFGRNLSSLVNETFFTHREDKSGIQAATLFFLPYILNTCIEQLLL